MVTKFVKCTVELDTDATTLVEAIAAMMKSRGWDSDNGSIVSNAVRIAYEAPVAEITDKATNGLTPYELAYKIWIAGGRVGPAPEPPEK